MSKMFRYFCSILYISSIFRRFNLYKQRRISTAIKINRKNFMLIAEFKDKTKVIPSTRNIGRFLFAQCHIGPCSQNQFTSGDKGRTHVCNPPSLPPPPLPSSSSSSSTSPSIPPQRREGRHAPTGGARADWSRPHLIIIDY